MYIRVIEGPKLRNCDCGIAFCVVFIDVAQGFLSKLSDSPKKNNSCRRASPSASSAPHSHPQSPLVSDHRTRKIMTWLVGHVGQVLGARSKGQALFAGLLVATGCPALSPFRAVAGV